MASNESQPTRGVEDVFDTVWSYYGVGPEWRGDYWSGYYGSSFVAPPYFLDSQKRGEALPFYLNHYQLKVLRDRSRRLCGENEFAVCAQENRISFIIGGGLKYRVVPTREGVTDSLVDTVQQVIDVFADANNLSEIEQQTVRRDDRDGESFLRLFYQDEGLVRIRFTEPEHVRSPAGESDAVMSFGIETRPGDICDPVNYYIVDNPLGDNTPKPVPAREVLHSKVNVDSTSKRGLPTFYPVEANLRRAEELLAALTHTAKTRAKIALIRRIEGTSKSAAESLKTEAEDARTFDPVTGQTTNVEQFKLGTILTASKNIGYEFPELQGADPGIEVLKAELRAVAARLVMPEVMLTADASNGTYSSQLVAEAPATRNFQRLQKYYGRFFGESREPGRESLMWRQIAWAVECGILPQQALTDVRIVVEAPAIIPRDPDKASTASKTYFDMGVISPQIICAQLGYDWDRVQRERRDAGLPPVSAQAGALPPGQGGMPAGGAAPGGLAGPPPAGPEGMDGAGAAGPSPSPQPGNKFEFDASLFDDL